ncbi:hypothetical protein [Planomonospora venezuelensis]|uniref:Uncharacterized protein n=1 Tax=Planomonospora venezuelensis TaxID=1999 RepID=A0A841CU86_PLAVE|nr:hypothetical protein [Planomonospora venezuelensis]MBB5961972.1 hypothetical protein [Planomonospora venezuelensis]
MQEMIIGVVSSLVAAALVVMAGWLGASRPRRLLIHLLSKMTGMGVERSYPDQKAANADLAADLREARWVRVLAGRGNELTRDSFQALWRPGRERLESVEVLLPDPDDTGGWLRARGEEIRRSDPGFDAGVLAEQISANITYLSTVSGRNPAVRLRLFDAPHSCRVIATDQVVYFTPYLPGAHGRNSPCLVFRSDGVMYEYALQIFARLWRAATPVP